MLSTTGVQCELRPHLSERIELRSPPCVVLLGACAVTICMGAAAIFAALSIVGSVSKWPARSRRYPLLHSSD